MMRIRWLQAARKNLDEAAAYIARDNPEEAGKMYSHIRNSVDALNQYPERGRPGRIFGTRELVISGYPFIVPYRVRKNEVQILRVFHTSRQLPEDW